MKERQSTTLYPVWFPGGRNKEEDVSLPYIEK